MAWPPATWERAPSVWRDDLSSAPDPWLLPQLPEDVAERQQAPSNRAAFAREAIETIALTVAIFFGIRLVVQNFRIEGQSMEPTLQDKQYLLVNKLAYGRFGRPHRGDIVVFEAWGSDKDFIKRIVAMPGDTIEIHDDKVWVDGTPLDEPYLDEPTRDTLGPVHLKPGEYYVLGDNRGNSTDSRTYGPLPAAKIVGKAWILYWPARDVGFIPDSRTSFASSR
jgi:signal peptidase I